MLGGVFARRMIEGGRTENRLGCGRYILLVCRGIVKHGECNMGSILGGGKGGDMETLG
jgi:hypothetical protein